MNLYVDPNTSEVFGYDDEQVASGLVRSGLVPCPSRPSIHHTWSNGWVLLDSTPIKNEVWQQIKGERDRRKGAGVKVGDYWFHTDDSSRIQWLGLKDQARDVLASGGTVSTVMQKYGQDILWKTMSGAFIPVSIQLAIDVVAGTGNLDATLFAKAEQHKAAMAASSDPASYNFLTGWPPAYGE